MKKLAIVFVTAVTTVLLSVSQVFAITLPDNYSQLGKNDFNVWNTTTSGYNIGDVFQATSISYGTLYYIVIGENQAVLCTPDGEELSYEQVQEYFYADSQPSDETAYKRDTADTNKKTENSDAQEQQTTVKQEAKSSTSTSNLSSSGDPTLGRLIGDISRGNHPNAPYAESKIIVPRPYQSRFAPIAKAGSNTNFADIQGHWAETSIKRFVSKGYLAGYSNGSFQPDAPVTYGELATIFCRLDPKPIRFDFIMEYDLINIFSHKDTNAWYYPSLLVADEAGFWGNNVKLSYEAGFMSNNRRPNTIYGQLDAEGNASRQYVALFLANMVESRESDNTVSLNYKDKNSINANSDGDIPKAIKRLVNNDIISGYPDNTFRPNAPVTRAELVAMLTKILDTYQWDMDAVSDNLYGNYKQFFWEQDEELLKLVNDARIAGGVKPVTYNADLQAICEVKMIDKTINGYDSFGSAHTCSYGTMEEMRVSFGFPTYIGENAAAAIGTPNKMYQTYAKQAHEGWTESQGHHDNYMNPKHVYGGFALGECYGYEGLAFGK